MFKLSYKMSSLVSNEKSFLELLLQTTPTQRKLLLGSLTKPQLKVLGEIAANVIHSVIVLNQSEKNILKKHKSFLFILGDKKASRKSKLLLLKRKHWIVPVFLKIVKPFLKRWWT